MSSTNKTSNYQLSQFIGTDKPAWLADYNQDMSKIDTQMKSNADASTTNAGNITTNTNAIGDLTDLNTTAKTDLVTSINEVNAKSGTAQGTAESAANNANAAKSEADALTRYLSITNTAKISPTITGGTTGNINDLYYALNADGTLGKIYGRYRFTKTSTGTATLTLPVAGLNVSEAFTISSGCFYMVYANNTFTILNARDIRVNTNNTVTIEFPSTILPNDMVTVWFPPCLYFFTDFGDVINPNS